MNAQEPIKKPAALGYWLLRTPAATTKGVHQSLINEAKAGTYCFRLHIIINQVTKPFILDKQFILNFIRVSIRGHYIDAGAVF